jgi:hypothetical protein
MPQFAQVDKTDLAHSASIDLEALAPYLSYLEPVYGDPDIGGLVLTLDEGETHREVSKNMQKAFRVLQARNGNQYPDNALQVRRRGSKVTAEITRTPPARQSRPRKSKKSE